MKVRTYDRLLILLSVLGVLVSTYALYVELKVEANPNYKAFCDFSERASCTRVLTSKYAKGLGIIDEGSYLRLPNPIYGTIHYCIMIILSAYDSLVTTNIQFSLAGISSLLCCYLAYNLIYVLKDICVVCISTYLINGTMLFLIWSKFKRQAKKIA
ncbi:vitamin K epoxide reductase complex subunit 1-like protein 1 [Bombyx mandarina]|uniref:vitamin-K-epoxide reductase (warfarin-sensitive) n=1 Tax=Bombyx mandarina TaxID=7092 RepID=A0A6J2KLG5_BOMMA|nr:vitamin K epoxide reductase complex subunit 1-like protein 1 [Bombyx mandarina]